MSVPQNLLDLLRKEVKQVADTSLQRFDVDTAFAKFDFIPRFEFELEVFQNDELEILCESKVDRDWAVVRLKSEKDRLGILPFTYIKAAKRYGLTTGADFYPEIDNLKDKERIWLLEAKLVQAESRIKQVEGQMHELRQQVESYEDCVVCVKPVGSGRMALTCGHSFCEDCTNHFWKEKKCPVCNQRPNGLFHLHL